MNRKASHVGVVLSFVIFITFIIFLYSITEPATTVDRGKEDLLEYLKTELIRDFSADMTTETILIKDSVVSDCVRIDTEDGDLTTIAKDEETGNILESYFDGNKVEIKRNSATNLKVYYSEEFPEIYSSLGCTDLNEEDYEFGLVRTMEEIFESRILNFSNFINNSQGYDSIKEEYNIPPGSEFGFAFEDGNRNVLVETQDKDVSTDIYVNEVTIQYIDNEANIKPGFIRIKVW